MRLVWHNAAWEEYLKWQQTNKKTCKKINSLIKDILRNGYNCIGKPEPLRGNFSGFWSVRIDSKNRLVFRINDDDLEIVQCATHYCDI